MCKCNKYRDDKLHHECGVLGVYGVPDAAGLAYYGLHALQHRGQQGCGIVTVDSEGLFHRVKGDGLVTEVFNEAKMGLLPGHMAIGHVRYSNAGCNGTENLQPFLFHHNSGDFALANNGQIVNYHQLREELEDRGSLFQSSSDAEILAHLIKKQGIDKNQPRIEALKTALNVIDGAFAFVVMTGRRIYACRDKYGFHPLALGKLGEGYVVASETCAFDVIGAAEIKEILKQLKNDPIMASAASFMQSPSAMPCVRWNMSISPVLTVISKDAMCITTERSLEGFCSVSLQWMLIL